MFLSFQFHKGTIRTSFFERQFYVDSLFQFHKGTIRTSRMLCVAAVFNYFNSIKVQLEHTTVLSVLVLNLFQFHKVQLELTNSDGSQSAFALISIP